MKENRLLYNRYAISFTLLIFTNILFNGCYSINEIEIPDEKESKIYKIETTDGKLIDFSDNKLGYAVLSKNEVVSINKYGDKETYHSKNIKKYYTKSFSAIKTIGLVTISILVLLPLAYILIITQTKNTDKWGD